MEKFFLAASKFEFYTAVAGAPIQAHKIGKRRRRDIVDILPAIAQFMLLVQKRRQISGQW
jgi:hypothetical protein